MARRKKNELEGVQATSLENSFWESEDAKEPKKKKIWLIILIIIAAAIVAAAIALFYYSRVTYKNLWYPKTTLNGVDVSGMTLEESRKAVVDKMENYTLAITGREDGKLEIKATDVDYHVTLSDEFESMFSKEQKQLAFPWKSWTWEMEGAVSYDKKKLKKLLTSSEIYKGSELYQIHLPKPTRIAYSTEEKQVVVEDPYAGNRLKKKPFIKVVSNALDHYQRELDLDDMEHYPDVYKKAKELASKEELLERLPKYNKKVLHYLVWEFPDKSTQGLTPELLYDWVSWEDGECVMSEEKLTTYLKDLSDKYTTVGTKRTVKGHDGKTFEVEGGDYGWMLSYNSLYYQAKEVLHEEIDEETLKAYQKDPSEKNIEKLTRTYTAPFVTSGAKFNPKNPSQDYDTKNFTEVDLGEQMVYVIRKGKVADSFRCISGRASSKRKTKPGTFYIKERQYYRVLKGDDYETPVHYWSRITWGGVGFHAAPWQGWGSWSPTYYIYGGSHGCINLTTSDAKTIYGLLKDKETVFMHY